MTLSLLEIRLLVARHDLKQSLRSVQRGASSDLWPRLLSTILCDGSHLLLIELSLELHCVFLGLVPNQVGLGDGRNQECERQKVDVDESALVDKLKHFVTRRHEQK